MALQHKNPLARLAGHEVETQAPLQRLAAVTLDTTETRHKSPLIEAERTRAISELLQDSQFSPVGHSYGTYQLHLTLHGQHLKMQISTGDTRDQLVTISLPLPPFRPLIRDYFLTGERFYKAAKAAQMGQLESIDKTRNTLHDEGAKLLKNQLREKIVLDKGTARRLFSLICVLHIRSLGLPH